MTADKDLEPQPGQLRVLHVEDNELDAELVVEALRKGGFSVSVALVQTEKDFERELRSHLPDVVLADYNLPQWKGMEALDVLQRENLDIPLILVSGALGDVMAVECIKRGATDYVLKEGLARLPEAVRRALQEKHLLHLRRLAEGNLARKVEELARSNAELQQFAYIASHDLQEPLRKIQAFGDRLAEHSSGALDEEAEDCLRRMMNAADRMQSLITALLQYSRVTMRPEPPRPVDLSEVVSDVLSDLEERIHESHGTVLVGPLPTVSASPLQMRELFQNLIANALKFHADGVAPEVHVAAIARGDRGSVKGGYGHTPVWAISVSDNGIGFEAKYVERIFAPFQRLNGRQAFEGTGMGLAICRRIVALRGGTITATSQPGAGATFLVTLPRTTVAADVIGPAA